MDWFTPEDVLMDIFSTSVLIGTRGSTSSREFAELALGFKKMAAFVFSGHFTIDSAVLCAAKAAYLAGLIRNDSADFVRNMHGKDISTLLIEAEGFSKLNKVKKTSPEAFCYFFEALRLIGYEKT